MNCEIYTLEICELRKKKYNFEREKYYWGIYKYSNINIILKINQKKDNF